MKYKHVKVEEGKERNILWRSMSSQQKLDALDIRLGKGVGAKRQRAKYEKNVSIKRS